MRFFAGFLVVVMLLGGAWSKYITNDGLVAYYDRNPKASSGASVLCYLGKGYEVVGNYEKMQSAYARVVERYPETPYAMEAQYGVAFALEKMNRYPEAIAEYEKFLEKYPNSKYAKSVRNNIEILRSR